MNQALSSLPTGTVVYNDYALGGWLEWKHRNVVPVIDGLTDAYPVSYVSSYMDALHLEPGWRKFVGRSGARYALLERDAPLAAALEDDGWKPMVRESDYVLLRHTSGTT